MCFFANTEGEGRRNNKVGYLDHAGHTWHRGHGQRDRNFVYNNNQISVETENLHGNLEAESLGLLAFYSSCYCYLDLGMLRDWECLDNRKLTALSCHPELSYPPRQGNVPTPKHGHVYSLVFQHTKWET